MGAMRIHTLMQGIFLLLALLHIAARAADLPMVATVTKPLLMPALAAWLFAASSGMRSGLFRTFLALGFSMIGDVLLMCADHPERGFAFFLGGVAAFGLAQGAYVLQFLRFTEGGAATWFRRPVPILVLASYLLVMLVLLAPQTSGPVRMAVVIYGLLLCGMVLASLHVRMPGKPSLLAPGAILFLLSDSLLAFDRFHTPIPLSGVWIMTSYLAGQGLIALGTLAAVRAEQKKR